MPAYDYICRTCQIATERRVPYDNRDNQVCECGLHLERAWLAAPALSAMPTTQQAVGGVGRMGSWSQQRKFEAEHPDVEILSTTDMAWRKRKDRARERAERNARKWGFRDYDSFQSTAKAAKAVGTDAFTYRNRSQ